MHRESIWLRQILKQNSITKKPKNASILFSHPKAVSLTERTIASPNDIATYQLCQILAGLPQNRLLNCPQQLHPRADFAHIDQVHALALQLASIPIARPVQKTHRNTYAPMLLFYCFSFKIGVNGFACVASLASGFIINGVLCAAKH